MNFAGWTFPAADELNKYGDIDLDGSTIDFNVDYDTNHNMDELDGYYMDYSLGDYQLTYDAHSRLIKAEQNTGLSYATVYECDYNLLGKLAWERYGSGITETTPIRMPIYGPEKFCSCGVGASPTELIEDGSGSGGAGTLAATYCPGPNHSFVSSGGGSAGHGNPALTGQGLVSTPGSGLTQPVFTVQLDKTDVDGDGYVNDYVTIELLYDRLGSVIACSTNANQGMDGPFIVERIDYLGGYGAAAYSDIVCAGYVSAVDTRLGTMTLAKHTHFGSGKGTISELANTMACIDPGNDDSNYTLISSGSYGGSGEIVLSTKSPGNFAVDDYVEIWTKALTVHKSTDPSESNGRTTVTCGTGPSATNILTGCYVLDLDASDMRVPVVVTANTTTTLTVEGTNLFNDTQWGDNNHYIRIYRRDSVVGNPFGFAGGWLIGGNYNISSNWRSVKQLWYFWNRHYEPEYLLRWLQPDPIGTWGDGLQRGSWLAYAAHSPSQFVDAKGTVVQLPGGTKRNEHDFPLVDDADADLHRNQLLDLFNFLLQGCAEAYTFPVLVWEGRTIAKHYELRIRNRRDSVPGQGCECDCSMVLDYFERALKDDILIGAAVSQTNPWNSNEDIDSDWGGGYMQPNTSGNGPYDATALLSPSSASALNADKAVTLAHELFGHALHFAEGQEWNRSGIIVGNEFSEHLRCVLGAQTIADRDFSSHASDPRGGALHPNDALPWTEDLQNAPR